MIEILKKYLAYLFRWQLSTPILSLVLIWLATMNKWVAVIIANLIGGLIFFWVDRWIFKDTPLAPLWEIREKINCADCGNECRGFRVVRTSNYDRSVDKKPEFRCEHCSKNKLQELEKRGIKL